MNDDDDGVCDHDYDDGDDDEIENEIFWSNFDDVVGDESVKFGAMVLVMNYDDVVHVMATYRNLVHAFSNETLDQHQTSGPNVPVLLFWRLVVPCF